MSLPHQITGDLITATIWNTQVDAINALLAAGGASVTTTGNISGLTLPTGTGPLYIRMNNASLATIQGIQPGLDGQELTIYSIGAGQVDLSNQDAGAVASTYRLINYVTSGKTSLAPGVGMAKLQYDSAVSRWRLQEHEQGDFIEYGLTSTITGWVLPASFQNIRYKLVGRELTVLYTLSGTSNATSSSFTIPYTSGNIGSQYADVSAIVTNSGTTSTTPGLTQVLPSATTVSIFRDGNSLTWTASGTKSALGKVIVQVT